MAISSKISIDVDGAAFRAFQEKFDQYKAGLRCLVRRSDASTSHATEIAVAAAAFKQAFDVQ
jgi:hypothetical protein